MLSLISAAAPSLYERLDETERLALNALYEATDGVGWAKNDGWLQGEPCGSSPYYATGWAGVECNSVGGHVRTLQLGGVGLQGTIPTTIGLLTEISRLDLSRGDASRRLSGTLPEALFSLPFTRGSTFDALNPTLRLSGQDAISGLVPSRLWGRLTEDLDVCELPTSIAPCSLPAEAPLACFSERARKHCGRPLPYGQCQLWPNGTAIAEAPVNELCLWAHNQGWHSPIRVNESLAERLLHQRQKLTSLQAVAGAHPSVVRAATRQLFRSRHTGVELPDVQMAARAKLASEHLWARASFEGMHAADGAATGDLAAAWSSHLTRLRRSLHDCCMAAPMQPKRQTLGSWPTRRMHPCCGTVLPGAGDVAPSGVSVGGDVSWRRFVRKLRAGRPTSIVALGSSISTKNYAGCDGGVFNGKEPLIQCEDHKGRWPGDQPGVGWLRMFGDWLNAVFPVGARHRRNSATATAPAGKHTVYAMGRTGSGADAFIDCFQTHIKKADLVLLEFAVVGPGSSSFEALVRRVLSMQGSTAAAFVNFWSWCRTIDGCMSETGIESPHHRGIRSPVGPLSSSTGVVARLNPFTSMIRNLANTTPPNDAVVPWKAEYEVDQQMRFHDEAALVARYYGVPLVSLRDALLPAILAQRTSLLDWKKWQDYDYHPSPSSNAAIAELLAEAVARTAVSLADEGDAAALAAAAAAATAAAKVGVPAAAATASTWDDEWHEEPPLPPPMHHDQVVRHTKACYHWLPDKELLSLGGRSQWSYRLFGLPPTLSSEGWEMSRQERTSAAGRTKTNPGLLAERPGAVLSLELDTSPVNHASASTAGTGTTHAQAAIQLDYLQSYQHMGILRVSCAEGCACEDTTIDAHFSGAKVSVHVSRCIVVTPAQRCVLRLETLQETSSGEHKFLLHELRVSTARAGDMICDASRVEMASSG